MNLPRELHLKVIKHIDSPRDLLSLVSTCRTTLHLFKSHRRSIIPRHQDRILSRLTSKTLLPKVLLATHLRNLDRATSTEQDIRTLLDNYKWSPEERLPSSLPVLVGIWNLLNDVDEVMADYMRTGGMSLLPSRGRRGWRRVRPSPFTSLSPEHKKQLQMAILQYECYCHAFFRGETVLMPTNLDDRHNLIAGQYTLSTFTAEDPVISKFYSVLNYALNRHSNIFDKIVSQGGSKYIAPRLIQEEDEIYRLQHFFRAEGTPEMEQARRLEEIRLKYRAPLEVHCYINWLCSQGIGPLLRLSRRDLSGQEDFTLAAFAQVSRNQSPFASGWQRLRSGSNHIPHGPWMYMHVFGEERFSWSRPRYWDEGHHEGLFRYGLLW